MGRRSALGQLSVEDLTLLLQLVAIDKLRPAAIWRSLPERIKSLFAGGDSVKATVKSHLNKLSDPTVTVTNVHDVARSLLGRLGKPCDEADHGRDRSASPPPRGSRSLVSSVHAGPDGDPYDTILRYAPVPEVRVPPTTPEARRILYGRAPHPTDASLDIIRVGIVVLRDSVVNTIMSAAAGAATEVARPSPEVDSASVGGGSLITLAGGGLHRALDVVTGVLGVPVPATVMEPVGIRRTAAIMMARAVEKREEMTYALMHELARIPIPAGCAPTAVAPRDYVARQVLKLLSEPAASPAPAGAAGGCA